ncbi:MAG: branched-chain amino acid ABC transporter permease [Oscillatoriales cyanobacterium]|nr:MAG: branched-chain amino acid ABC transporter permease [Oscillatoriales cyanobacterium]
MIGYLTSLIVFSGIFALFGLGLNVQWGLTGLINFGHVAFMTIGAYTTILLSLQGWPIALAVAAGAALAALLGLLVGISTLRLREDYLAIVTIGVSEVVRLVALNEEWLTRGARGVYGYPLPLSDLPDSPIVKISAIALWTVVFGAAGWQLTRWFRRSLRDRRAIAAASKANITTANITTGITQQPPSLSRLILGGLSGLFGSLIYGCGAIALWDFNYKTALMLLVVVTLGLVYWQLERLARSPWGRVLKAIREDEEIARALGKNAFWYKLQSLMLGGSIAGVAGSFYAWNLTFINPDGFIPLMTFQVWTIVVLGGAGNNAGTLLGSVLFWGYTTLTRFVLPMVLPLDEARLGAFRLMAIGLILIVLMMWRPQGILGNKEELTLGR